MTNKVIGKKGQEKIGGDQVYLGKRFLAYLIDWYLGG